MDAHTIGHLPGSAALESATSDKAHVASAGRVEDHELADKRDARQRDQSLPAAEKPRKLKSGRTRYQRLFPERTYFLFEHLNDREFVAYMRLLTAYVVTDGVLSADDKRLAIITKTGTRWPELRDKLITLGLGRIDGGLWIDDDQQGNLDIQRRLSDRGSKGAKTRWGDRHA
jgi:hypothetical protein